MNKQILYGAGAAFVLVLTAVVVLRRAGAVGREAIETVGAAVNPLSRENMVYRSVNAVGGVISDTPAENTSFGGWLYELFNPAQMDEIDRMLGPWTPAREPERAAGPWGQVLDRPGADQNAADATATPSYMATATRTTLRYGSRGDAVVDLQRKLGITADGIFGPATDAAVREFQSLRGLAVDGVVGPKTWAQLDNSRVQSAIAGPVAPKATTWWPSP